MQKTFGAAAFGSLILVLLASQGVKGQVPAPARAIHPEDLVDYQREAKRQLENLLRRLKSMADRLQQTAPEDAQKTRKVQEELYRRDTLRRMEAIMELLKQRKYPVAVSGQTQVIEDLKAVIRFLKERKLGERNWEKQLEQLRRARESVGRLLADQRDLRRVTEQGRGAEGISRRFDALARRVAELQAKQKNLAAGKTQGLLPSDREIAALAEKVQALEKRQRALAAQAAAAPDRGKLLQLAREAEKTAEALQKGTPGPELKQALQRLAQAAESLLRNKELAAALRSSQSGALGSAEGRKSLLRALKRLDAESRQGGPLSDLVTPQAELEFQTRKLRRTLSELKQALPSAKAALSQADSALSKASAAMGNAATSLQRGLKQEGISAQRSAAEELSRARSSLSSLARALKGQDRFARAKEAQERLAKKTEEVRKELAQLRKLLEQSERKGGEGARAGQAALSRAQQAMQKAAQAFSRRESGASALARKAAEELRAAEQALKEEALKRLRRHELQKLAAKQEELRKQAEALSKRLRQSGQGAMRRAAGRVSRAGGHMGRASESLRNGSPGDAGQAQQQAIDELAQAEKELGKEEQELERLRQEEQITNMVELLIKVRDGEKEILSGVKRCESSRSTRGRLPRSSRVLVRKLARRQQELIQDGGKVKELLAKEKAEVFAYVVEDALGDMEQVRGALVAEQTGRYVQLLVQDVIDKLNRLLQALQEELSQRRQNRRRRQQAGAGKPRLVPPVAEALMLKRMQLAINERTEAIERARRANRGRLTPAMERELNRLALKQGALAALTRKVARDFLGVAPEEDQEAKGERKKLKRPGE